MQEVTFYLSIDKSTLAIVKTNKGNGKHTGIEFSVQNDAVHRIDRVIWIGNPMLKAIATGLKLLL